MQDLRDQLLELDDNMLEYVYGGIDIPDEIIMELELANKKGTASLRVLNFSSLVGAAENLAEAFGGK